MFTYYATLERDKYIEIEHVQYDYINLLLMDIFGIWKSSLDGSLTSTRNSLTLTIVLFLICSILGFLFLWALYLSKLNVRLNQTIQMLNMIPIRMLPKSRKDIRDFFSWIIKEANRNKTDD
jgi:ABC-type Fe3+ transport system permease subunit